MRAAHTDAGIFRATLRSPKHPASKTWQAQPRPQSSPRGCPLPPSPRQSRQFLGEGSKLLGWLGECRFPASEPLSAGVPKLWLHSYPGGGRPGARSPLMPSSPVHKASLAQVPRHGRASIAQELCMPAGAQLCLQAGPCLLCSSGSPVAWPPHELGLRWSGSSCSGSCFSPPAPVAGMHLCPWPC